MDLKLNEGLTLNEQAKTFLSETAKWAKFLAIMGFIFVGFMVIVGLSFGSIMGAVSSLNPNSSAAMNMMPMGLMGGVYVVMALIYFFPIWYMFQFAVKMQMALQAEDENALTEAFKNLKSHYKFMGIFTIVVLSFYVLMFLFSGIMFASAL